MEFNKPSTLNLNGNVAENFQIFKEEFSIYFVATKTDKESKTVQLARLKNLLGSDGLKLYNSMKDDTVTESIEYVIDTLEQHCVPKKNVTMDIFKLLNRKQGTDETFEQFYAELKSLIKPCRFDEQEDKLLKALIVFGVKNSDLQERLLREDVTLDKMLNFCRASEVAGRNVKLITVPSDSSTEVDAIKAKTCGKVDHEEYSGPGNSNSLKRVTPKTCFRCGKLHTGTCPAMGKICNKCKRPNHFANVCKTNPTRYAELISCTEPQDESTINSLCTVDSIRNKNSWYKTVQLERNKITFKLDSGADVNILPFHVYKGLTVKPKVMRCNTTLQSFGGFKITPCGYIEALIESNSKIINAKFLIVNNLSAIPILGLQTCMDLNLIKRVDSLKEVSNEACEESEKMKMYESNKDVFEGLGCFPDECRIKIKEDAVPTMSTARRLPWKIKDKFKETLNKLAKSGIITLVEEPVDWVNNVVVVEKPNGSLRLCIDPIDLNKYIIREKFTIPTLNEISPKLANKSCFSILDLKDGFYHVPLDERSSKLCSFATVFGTYRFLRAPFGLSCMPEIFQRLVTKYFSDIPGVSVYFDDLCVSSNSKEENDQILEQVFERARKYNIKFNLSKFQYCKNEVKYLGVKFSKNGMLPDPEKIEVIRQLKSPNNKTELQRVLGMVNYLRAFIPKLSEITSPLRELLKKNVVWLWTENHTKVFEDMKKLICSPQILSPYDPNLPIEVQCDASKDAIGFCMLQKGRPVHFGSRSMNDAEVNYAQIEKEHLAICFAVNKLHNYIYGHNDVTVHTDHLPLVSIAVKPLNKIANNRLKRLKLKLIDYNLKIKYLPGKYMYIADFLSRCGIKTPGFKDPLMDDYIHTVQANEIVIDEPRLKLFQTKTLSDETLSLINEYLHNGWPDVKQLQGEIKHYYNIRNEIQENDDLLYFGDRLLVPQTLRKLVLETLHETHLGVSKIIRKMKQCFYWPGVSSDVTNIVSACKVCQKFAKSKTKCPMLNHDIPNLPFSKIGVDIAEFQGHSYLVLVDFYSRWIEAAKVNSKNSKTLIEKLKEIFSRFGIPKLMIADNVPFASLEFKQFSSEWDFKITTTSPYFSQSNGLSEKAVGIVKDMLKKCKETKQSLEMYLLNYRNSPVSNLEFSPSQLLNSRHVRSKIPLREEMLRPHVVPDTIHENMLQKQKEQKMYYDKTALKKEEVFKEGDKVWVQDAIRKTWDEGVILKKLEEPRSYNVKIKEKGIKRRNQIHIKRRNS